jgi:DNA-binding MarR family transcriptional regulator
MSIFETAAREIAGECAGLRVRQASRLLTRLYDDALRPLGVQESQFSVVVTVAMFGEGGVTMSELAEQLVMDRTTLTRNIVPLEKAGYLRVARSPSDARSRIVLLSRAGEQLIEAGLPRWRAAQRRVHRVLGGARFDRLRAELSAVIARAGELEAGAAPDDVS